MAPPYEPVLHSPASATACTPVRAVLDWMRRR